MPTRPLAREVDSFEPDSPRTGVLTSSPDPPDKIQRAGQCIPPPDGLSPEFRATRLRLLTYSGEPKESYISPGRDQYDRVPKMEPTRPLPDRRSVELFDRAAYDRCKLPRRMGAPIAAW